MKIEDFKDMPRGTVFWLLDSSEDTGGERPCSGHFVEADDGFIRAQRIENANAPWEEDCTWNDLFENPERCFRTKLEAYRKWREHMHQYAVGYMNAVATIDREIEAMERQET